MRIQTNCGGTAYRHTYFHKAVGIISFNTAMNDKKRLIKIIPCNIAKINLNWVKYDRTSGVDIIYFNELLLKTGGGGVF